MASASGLTSLAGSGAASGAASAAASVVFSCKKNFLVKKFREIDFSQKKSYFDSFDY